MALSIITNIFAGNPLDRASERRGDEAWLAEKADDPHSLAVAIWDGKALVEDIASPQDGEDGKAAGVQIAYLRADMAKDLAGTPERLLFLGLWKDIAVFAVDLEGGADPAEGPLQGLGRFEELRGVALTLPPPDAGILATAKSMFEWRRKHKWCSNCGQETQVSDGGWKRQCASCQAEHFPRTDPVAIMLALHDGKCLLDGRRRQRHRRPRPDRAGSGQVVHQGRGQGPDRRRAGRLLRPAPAGDRAPADQGLGGGGVGPDPPPLEEVAQRAGGGFTRRVGSPLRRSATLPQEGRIYYPNSFTNSRTTIHARVRVASEKARKRSSTMLTLTWIRLCSTRRATNAQASLIARGSPWPAT
jgi:hypothetical protein